MKFSKFNAQHDHCTEKVFHCIESVKNFELLYENPEDCMSCMQGPIIRTAEFHWQCKLSDKQLVIGDSFFSSVQSASTKSMKKYGRHYLGIVKQAHAKNPKVFLKDSIKNVPADAFLLLTSKFEGVYLCALGYKVRRFLLSFLPEEQVLLTQRVHITSSVRMTSMETCMINA